MQRQGRLPGRQIHHPQIGQKHPIPKPRAQGLGTSLLGRKTLGITRRRLPRPLLSPRPLNLRKHPLREPLPMPLQRPLNAANIANVGTEPEDHALARSTCAMLAAPRRPAMTWLRWRVSRTSTSTMVSKKSCWRWVILRLAIAPPCCETALVRLARAFGLLLAMTLMRPTNLLFLGSMRAMAALSQSTS